MSTPDARIAALIDEGRITEAEGQRLRRALQPRSGLWAPLLNPVEYVRPGIALLLAAGVVAASLAVWPLDFRFDGALDIHRVMQRPAWTVAVLDQCVAIGLTAVLLWLASLVVARQGRLQDFVSAVTVARLPILFIVVWSLLVLPAPEEVMRQARSGQLSMRMLVGGVGSSPFFVWFLVWLYRGFAHASGLRGARGGVVFVITIVIAEILSIVVLR